MAKSVPLFYIWKHAIKLSDWFLLGLCRMNLISPLLRFVNPQIVFHYIPTHICLYFFTNVVIL